MAAELRKLGAGIVEGPDFIEVTPPAAWRHASVHTYDDHRMGMSFALAAVLLAIGVGIERLITLWGVGGKARELAERGIRVVISNHDTSGTRELYFGAQLHFLDARRSIAATPTPAPRTAATPSPAARTSTSPTAPPARMGMCVTAPRSAPPAPVARRRRWFEARTDDTGDGN